MGLQPAGAAQEVHVNLEEAARILRWQALNQGAAAGAEGADAWRQFCDARQGDPNVAELLVRIPRPDGGVTQRLVALATWASALPAQGGGGGPPPHDHLLTRQQFLALGQALEEIFPSSVRQHEAGRVAGVLDALARAGVTAERLQMACRNAKWARDFPAQLASSGVGYTCSFMIFNTLMEQFWGDAAASGSLPVLAHTLLSMTAQRWLRMAEWLPGWTKAIEADGLGKPAPFITTPRGFRLATAQYWPFLASLAYGSYGVSEPRGRVEAFRNYGFAATAGVALHRLLFLSRDYPWLNASTPVHRSAMLQSIDELCSWQSTAEAVVKYVTVRPIAGLGGLLSGQDWHPTLVEPATTPAPAQAQAQAQAGQAAAPGQVAAGAAQAAGAVAATNVLPPRLLDSVKEEVATSAKRCSLFCVPMLLFGVVKSAAQAAGLSSDLVGTVNFLTLIPGWGIAMALNERYVVNDPGIAAEGTSRGDRLRAIQARQYDAAHPATAAPAAAAAAQGAPQ